MNAAAVALVIIAGLELALLLVAGFKGWLKPFVTGRSGSFDSTLFWRNVWQLAVFNGFLVLFVRDAFTWESIGLLTFGAAMAGIEGAQYIFRRGQDTRLDAAKMSSGWLPKPGATPSQNEEV